MADLLCEALPTVWAGRPIDPDFRHMIRLSNAYARKEPDKDPLGFAQEMCGRFYCDPVPANALSDAWKALVEFYLAAEPPRPGGKESRRPEERAFDYCCDAPYLVAAFQQLYSIDLTSETLHWWRFRALLEGLLGEECLFSRIVGWRTADLAELPEHERPYTERMRQRFALPEELRGGVAHAVTLAEHEAAFLARFRH